MKSKTFTMIALALLLTSMPVLDIQSVAPQQTGQTNLVVLEFDFPSLSVIGGPVYNSVRMQGLLQHGAPGEPTARAVFLSLCFFNRNFLLLLSPCARLLLFWFGFGSERVEIHKAYLLMLTLDVREEKCKMPARSVSLGEPEEVAPFHFYVDIGAYTGISAVSYKDFLKSIKQVNERSLSFHVKRGDFQKWAFDVLKDKKLAKAIERIRSQKLKGQALRNRLYSTVLKRHKELASKSTRARSR